MVIDPLLQFWNPFDVPIVLPTTCNYAVKYWVPPYDVGFLIKEKDGTDRFLSTSRWPVTDRTRSSIFFSKDPSTQRIRFRAVDELIPLAE